MHPRIRSTSNACAPAKSLLSLVNNAFLATYITSCNSTEPALVGVAKYQLPPEHDTTRSSLSGHYTRHHTRHYTRHHYTHTTAHTQIPPHTRTHPPPHTTRHHLHDTTHTTPVIIVSLGYTAPCKGLGRGLDQRRLSLQSHERRNHHTNTSGQ